MPSQFLVYFVHHSNLDEEYRPRIIHYGGELNNLYLFDHFNISMDDWSFLFFFKLGGSDDTTVTYIICHIQKDGFL